MSTFISTKNFINNRNMGYNQRTGRKLERCLQRLKLGSIFYIFIKDLKGIMRRLLKSANILNKNKVTRKEI